MYGLGSCPGGDGCSGLNGGADYSGFFDGGDCIGVTHLISVGLIRSNTTTIPISYKSISILFRNIEITRLHDILIVQHNDFANRLKHILLSLLDISEIIS